MKFASLVEIFMIHENRAVRTLSHVSSWFRPGSGLNATWCLPPVLTPFLSPSVSHSHVSLHLFLNTNCGRFPEKTRPESRGLTVVFFSHPAKHSGLQRRSETQSGILQTNRMFALIVCFLPRWDLYDLNNGSCSNSMFADVQKVLQKN